VTGARRLARLCAIIQALALGALACGRYGPPVRAVPSDTAARASETPDDTQNAIDDRGGEAVPYILEDLISDRDETIEGPMGPRVEPAVDAGPEKKAQPSE
jgi:hypothetical protein